MARAGAASRGATRGCAGASSSLVVLTRRRRSLVGFVWLPSVQRDFTRAGALGEHLPRRRRAQRTGAPPPTSREPARRRPTSCSSARWRARAPSDAVGRGATLALRLHDVPRRAGHERGRTRRTSPGQYPEVVIKQLHDYKRGKRAQLDHGSARARSCPTATSTTSRPTTPTLPKARTAPTDLRRSRCRRWCASATRCATSRPASPATAASTRSSARRGSRACRRTISSRSSKAFASGARRNDSQAQMRNMARAMTPREIEEVADFYARKAGSGERRRVAAAGARRPARASLELPFAQPPGRDPLLARASPARRRAACASTGAAGRS